MELQLADNAGDDDEYDGSGHPDPDRDLVFRRGKVFNERRLVVCFGRLLLQVSVVLAALLQSAIDRAGHVSQRVLEAIENDTDVDKELDQTVHDEHHDTGPQHPVSGRRNPSLGANAAHAVEVGQACPLARATRLAHALAVVDKNRSNKPPGSNSAEPPRDGGVEADQDTGAEEGGCKLDVPAPVLNVQSPVLVAAPDVEPGKDVPVVQDSVGILRNDDVCESAKESKAQGFDFAYSIAST